MSSFSPAIWHSVWQASCMPKVNFFVWLLLKNKPLIGENLLKHGFYGPFCYCFCKSALEAANPLLVECVFSRNAWAMVLHGVQLTFPQQNSVKELYTAWYNGCPSTNQATMFHKSWHSILKFTMWSLWLARKECVFNNHRPFFRLLLSSLLRG